jgi:mRNA interferase HigB
LAATAAGRSPAREGHFNVGGNNDRVVVKVIYPMGRVYVRFVGSHTAYDKINANEV